MKRKALEALGEPDIKIAGLRIWVHGREFPDSEDYWDANWLRVTAHCAALGAGVTATGSIIHLSELDNWVRQTEHLYETLKGEARLDCLEPELSAHIKAMSLGRIVIEVSITPNHLVQRHWFHFEIDQSYLRNLITECKAVLKEYPIKGNANP